ncbi:MAG: type II secretion system minor pseudopilin GspK [Desulfobacteraceae bacterium]
MIHGLPGQQGSVLVLALLVIATLTGLAVAFSGTARTEVSLAAFSRDGLRAEALARAGVEAALHAIAADEESETDHLEEDWGLFDGTSVPLEVPEESELSVRIQDESGRFNLNRVRNEAGEIDEEEAERLERLFDDLGLTRVAYESLLDWLDADDIKRLDGAESYFYEELETPYSCANQPLLSLGQVHLVRGLEQTDRLGEEWDTDLLDLVTIYATDGINVNTAPVEVLECLDEDMDRNLAEAIVDRRLDEPFTSIGEVQEVTGMEQEVFERVQGLLTVKTSLFRIRSEARCDKAECRIDAVVERSEDSLRCMFWKVY